MSEKWITVIEVARAMGLELSNDQAWSVGAAVRQRYQDAHGTLPPKALRPKTRGHGTHCFAVYPPSWRPVIQAAIEAEHPTTSPQGSFF